MRHIESSAKIVTTQLVDGSSVKYSLVQRLRGAFHVETVGEGTESFSISGTSKATSYVFNLNVVIKSEQNRVRVIVDGGNEVSIATCVFYVLSLLAVLALSLFPGTSEDKGAGNVVLEAIFFLVVGGFIISDMNKKFEEPQQMLDRIMKSLEAEFG